MSSVEQVSDEKQIVLSSELDVRLMTISGSDLVEHYSPETWSVRRMCWIKVIPTSRCGGHKVAPFTFCEISPKPDELRT